MFLSLSLGYFLCAHLLIAEWQAFPLGIWVMSNILRYYLPEPLFEATLQNSPSPSPPVYLCEFDLIILREILGFMSMLVFIQ